ncbi:MAG: hypothetical protein QXJ17_07395 [Nitrososphaeria archaeon]
MNKTIDVTGTYVFDPPDFVDFLDEIADGVVDALSLGIVDYDIDIKKVWAEYGATLRFSKFSFDLKPNNKVQVGDGSIMLTYGLGYMLKPDSMLMYLERQFGKIQVRRSCSIVV